MDLRWLTADEQQLEAAIKELDDGDRPDVKKRSFTPAAIAYCALLVYFGVVWHVFASRIDVEAGRIAPGALAALVGNLGVIVVLWYVNKRFDKWLNTPRRDVELRAWREHMTGYVNDVDIEPVHRATFVSLITGERRTAMCRPRFSAPGVEFGNLSSRTHSYLEWHYLATELPAPLPHVFLESRAAGRLPKELARAEIGQAVSMGAPFDNHFTVYAPRGYEHDALYVLTPAVMALLLDYATDFHVEIIGDTLVFFAPGHADFGTPAPWETIDALWLNVVPAIVTRAQRYRDERVPHQSFSHRILTLQEAFSTPGFTWNPPQRRIAPEGKRLRRRRRGPRWSIARKHGPELVLLLGVQALILFILAGIGRSVLGLYEAFIQS